MSGAGAGTRRDGAGAGSREPARAGPPEPARAGATEPGGAGWEAEASPRSRKRGHCAAPDHDFAEEPTFKRIAAQEEHAAAKSTRVCGLGIQGCGDEFCDLWAGMGIDLFMNQAADAIIVFEWKEGSPAPTVFAANKAAWDFTQAVGFTKQNSLGKTVVQLFDKFYTKKVFTAGMLEKKIKDVFLEGKPVQIFDDLPLPTGKMFFDDQYCRVRWPRRVAQMVQRLWQTNRGLDGLSGDLGQEREPGHIWKGTSMEDIRGDALRAQLDTQPECSDEWETYVLAICRNVTEAVKREQEGLITKARVAEEATKAKTMFLANISHDLRTPLAGVISSAELLKKNDLGNEEREWLLNTIVNSGGALMALCNDILDITRFERGEFKLECEPTDVRQCIETCRSMVVQQCVKKRLELKVEVHPSVPRLLVTDANRLQQILHNLMGNAVQYTEKGQVSVRVTSCPCPGQGGCHCHLVGEDMPPEGAGLQRVHLEMCVSDSGVGLAPDILGEIFRPFFQVKQSRFAQKSAQWEGGGAGLGLSIVKHLTQLLGGTVNVESELGKGTAFTVTLCIHAIPRESPTKALAVADTLVEASIGDRSSLRVLLAEDNPVMQRISHKILQSLGIEDITTVSNGQAALQVGRDIGAFDLIVLDWHMPNMDGLEVLREMNKCWGVSPDDPPFVVILTADATSSCAQPFLDLGANLFMSKPVNVARLREAADAALARRPFAGKPCAGVP